MTWGLKLNMDIPWNEKDLNVAIHELSVITAFVDSLPLECDGASRLLHLALDRAKVPHFCMYGSVNYLYDRLLTHFWIEVGPLIIDYRLRAWKGKAWGLVTPHGVFNRQETKVIYGGSNIFFDTNECDLLERVTMATLDREDLSHYPGLKDL